VVIGNHPHWVQGVELYKGKVISYALGNFIFDQSWSVPTQQGLVATYTFYGKKLLGMSVTPVHIVNQAQPNPTNAEETAQIMDQFRQSSLLMSTNSAVPAH
jgi:poly-gamma-glutamate synthesis protein (capsule biosynthesis protein)